MGSSFDGEKLWKESEDLRVVGRWEKVLLQWRRIGFEQEEGAIVGSSISISTVLCFIVLNTLPVKKKKKEVVLPPSLFTGRCSYELFSK